MLPLLFSSHVTIKTSIKSSTIITDNSSFTITILPYYFLHISLLTLVSTSSTTNITPTPSIIINILPSHLITTTCITTITILPYYSLHIITNTSIITTITSNSFLIITILPYH